MKLIQRIGLLFMCAVGNGGGGRQLARPFHGDLSRGWKDGRVQRGYLGRFGFG